MLRTLLLSAILCPLAFAETPKPPATLAELKANPAGLTEYGGDIREEYGQYPASSVYVRESDRGQVSYLLNDDKVFGYLFRFQKAGDDTQLWHDGIKAFLDSTFPEESFQCQNYSVSTINSIHYRTQAVLNTKAYEEAMETYRRAEQKSMADLLDGTGVFPGMFPKSTMSLMSRTLDQYLKSFPETKPASLEGGLVPGFESETSDLGDFPYDALHRRTTNSMELLILSRKGMIIGYLVKIPQKSAGMPLGLDVCRAGLAAAYPDGFFSRQEPPAGNGMPYLCVIKDCGTFPAAREAYVAEEAAKMKALLNP